MAHKETCSYCGRTVIYGETLKAIKCKCGAYVLPCNSDECKDNEACFADDRQCEYKMAVLNSEEK